MADGLDANLTDEIPATVGAYVDHRTDKRLCPHYH